MIEFDQPLSPAGMERSEQILRLVKRAARGRRRKRHLLRGGAVLAVLLVVGLVAHRMKPQVSPPVIVHQQIAQTTSVTIGTIETDPSITDRLSVFPQAARWKQIDDDELLRSLADAGQPAGIIRMEGQAVLVTSD